MKYSVLLLVLVVLSAGTSYAQRGNRKGHQMAPPPSSWKIPAAPVVSPKNAPKGFAVEEGFRIELVAAEPMIHDPVALAFDGNGRIWVAEMLGYMPDIEGKTESKTYGRISVLEDTDDDGAIDRHTVFLEKVLLPRALALVDAGSALLFSDNASLYEVEIKIDDEGKITPGKQTLVDKDYAKGGNPEHKSNGLLHGLDNWIYSAASSVRFRKIDGKWVKEKTDRRGQWGIDQDDYGHLFTNTNSNFVSGEDVPPNVKVDNPNHRFRSKGTFRMKDQKVWPSRINPGVNRGYMEATLDEKGFLRGPTAASGLAVYRGDQFPGEYYGNLFLNEPSGNFVKRAVMQENESGFREVNSAYEGKEFFTSTDERSRIVNCYTAPDGTLYLVDFYRGILQHAVYMTSFLREQVEERELQFPVGLGRIWRIAHDGGRERGPMPKMQNESGIELVAHLGHRNGWWRNTAQRLIVERGADEKTIGALRSMVTKPINHLALIHAMWALEGLGEFNQHCVRAGLKSKHPRGVAETIRVAGESLAHSQDEKEIVLEILQKQIGNKNIFVQRSLAASLGHFGVSAHSSIAVLLAKYPNDELLTDLVMSGISGDELVLFQKTPEGHLIRTSLIEAVVRSGDFEKITRLMGIVSKAADYRSLSKVLAENRRTDDVVKLLTVINSPSVNAQMYRAVVVGLLDAGKNPKFKPMPLKERHPIFKKPGMNNLAGLFVIGNVKKVVYLKTEADKKQFKLGETHYQKICLPCHQVHGKGQAFLAPPIVGSDWTMGPKKRLIALTMDGAQGPIKVLGKIYKAPDIQPLMPGLRANPELNDEQLAAILTYVRNAWGNGASPVSASEVKKYRESTELRAPYSPEELMKIR